MSVSIAGVLALLVGAGTEPDAMGWLKSYESSQDLMSIFSHGLRLPDADGSRTISDADLLIMLSIPHATYSYADYDRNDIVDPQEHRRALRVMLHAMAGDFNLDGKANAEDLSLLMDTELTKFGTRDRALSSEALPFEFMALEFAPLGGPTGVPVSAADVDAVLAAVAGVRAGSVGAAVDEVIELLDTAGVFDAALPSEHMRFFSGQYPNEKKPWDYPPNHARMFSDQWRKPDTDFPSLEPTHNTYMSSRAWPANHRNSVSLGWRGRRPGWHATNDSRMFWPPSHLVDRSRTWVPPGEGDGPGQHARELSRYWPPNHRLGPSGTTRHRVDWSAYAPDDPIYPLPMVPEHTLLFSGEWGPMHDRSLSMNNPNGSPDDHSTIESGHTPVHFTDISNHGWPPNHEVSISRGWAPTEHRYSVSSGWPPSHFQQMSATWPDGGRLAWPANHNRSISAEPDATEPSGLPPMFPEDHALVTTAIDIIDVIAP